FRDGGWHRGGLASCFHTDRSHDTHPRSARRDRDQSAGRLVGGDQLRSAPGWRGRQERAAGESHETAGDQRLRDHGRRRDQELSKCAMHPILATPRTLLWYALAWLLVGLVVAALLVTADRARWANALFFAVPVSVVLGFIAPSAYYVCRSLPLARRELVFVVAIFGAASLLSGFAWLG